MLEFVTQGFNGYSTQWSPFIDSRLAVAASANFGLVGNGRLYILNLTPTGIVTEKWFGIKLAGPHSSYCHMHLLTAGPGSTRKTRCSTSPGQRRTRTKSWLLRAMGPSNCSIHLWMSFPFGHGRNINGRSSPFIGIWSPRIPFVRALGMGRSRL